MVLSAAIFDNGEYVHCLFADDIVEHEVHNPQFVGVLRPRQWLPLAGG
jgi:hypothetical protein